MRIAPSTDSEIPSFMSATERDGADRALGDVVVDLGITVPVY